MNRGLLLRSNPPYFGGSPAAASNVILCTPKRSAERIYARVDAEVDPLRGLAFGACLLPNDAGLIFKLLGRETAQVKAKVREFWSIVRKEVIGADLPPPFLWR